MADGRVFLTAEHLIGVANRLSNLPLSNSDCLEQWLCVRYWETSAAKADPDSQGASRVQLPENVELRIASCIEFADALFGMPLDDSHPYFVVFKANAAKRRWPVSKAGNMWPAQSFWQRFKELDDNKAAHPLFHYSKGRGYVAIGTKRGEDGIQAFTNAILASPTGTNLLNVLDLAEWMARNTSWDAAPGDAEVVARFIGRIWLDDEEDVLFDEESRALLAAARSNAR
jgi:hypothetical protein